MTGKLTGLTFNQDGTQNITVTVTSDFRQEYDELKDVEIEVKISKYYPRRSNNANSYCWELCGKIAEKLSLEGTTYTKEDVYRNAIKEVGIWKDFTLDPEAAKTISVAWQNLGTGWVVEQVDYTPDGEDVIVRFYYGSSRYNVRQMSRLLDNLIQDCEALGIEHKTPEEIEKLKSLWATTPTERT